MNGVNSVKAGGSVYMEQENAVGRKNFESPVDSGSLKSAAPGATPAPAAKWTPPSCLALYCTYVKHRIADFLDWICCLFCCSKAVTEAQVNDVLKEMTTLDDKMDLSGHINKRYKGVKISSTDDAYPYIADYIESQKLVVKFALATQRLGRSKTERQLRANRRQLIELMTSIRTFVHSDPPTKITPAMRDKVKDYSLGKLTMTVDGEVLRLIDLREITTVPRELTGRYTDLVEEIRKSSLDAFDTQFRELSKSVKERYTAVTLQDLSKNGDSHAIHVLADAIAVKEIWDPLIQDKGDISKESLTQRIDLLNKRLAQPVLGEATPEMRKKVKESTFAEIHIVCFIDTQSDGRSDIKDRLREVLAIVKGPQGVANKQK